MTGTGLAHVLANEVAAALDPRPGKCLLLLRFATGSPGPIPNSFQGKERVMAKLKIRPLGDKVLLKRVEAEGKTAGGIVLTTRALG